MRKPLFYQESNPEGAFISMSIHGFVDRAKKMRGGIRSPYLFPAAQEEGRREPDLGRRSTAPPPRRRRPVWRGPPRAAGT
jgi:hypothetical protein